MKKKTKFKLLFTLIILLLWGVAIFKVYSLMYKFRAEESLYDEYQFPSPLKENTKEELFFINYINSLYSDYYDIQKVYVYDYVPVSIQNEKNTKHYFVSIQKKLKYKSVYEMPFVAGMKKALEELNNSKTATAIYNRRTNELKQYINYLQTENNIFKVVFQETNNFTTAKIKIATYHSEISANLLKPPASSDIFQEGYDFIYLLGVNNRKKIEYNNNDAIMYADKYSSNPRNKDINTKVWNKQFRQYENDCANYVSQCLYYGGIEPTKTWNPDSLFWIRTGSPRYADIDGLTTYMQKTRMFSLTNFSGVSAGGFICLIEESHVVFVASNDSITILFNGHTNDRKRVSFPHLNERGALYLTPNN